MAIQDTQLLQAILAALHTLPQQTAYQFQAAQRGLIPLQAVQPPALTIKNKEPKRAPSLSGALGKMSGLVPPLGQIAGFLRDIENFQKGLGELSKIWKASGKQSHAFVPPVPSQVFGQAAQQLPTTIPGVGGAPPLGATSPWPRAQPGFPAPLTGPSPQATGTPPPGTGQPAAPTPTTPRAPVPNWLTAPLVGRGLPIPPNPPVGPSSPAPPMPRGGLPTAATVPTAASAEGASSGGADVSAALREVVAVLREIRDAQRKDKDEDGDPSTDAQKLPPSHGPSSPPLPGGATAREAGREYPALSPDGLRPHATDATGARLQQVVGQLGRAALRALLRR